MAESNSLGSLISALKTSKSNNYVLTDTCADNVDKEVKAVLEMPGASKDHIKIWTYENSIEILTDHPQIYQVINIPQVADIKTIRSTYKNGILEIVFKKKEKLKPNNKRREIKIE